MLQKHLSLTGDFGYAVFIIMPYGIQFHIGIVFYKELYKELSFKEIAEKTNVSINTALGRMRYAIINLRKMAKERNTILNY